jgi:hypothetical protein
MPTRRFPPPWSVEEYNDPPKAAATRPSLRDFQDLERLSRFADQYLV